MGVFKDLLKSLIRAWMHWLLAIFVAKGRISKEDADAWVDPMTATIVGAIGFIGLYVWSARDKIKSWVFGKFARLAPANTSPQDIKTEVNALSLTEQVKEALTAAPTSAEKGV
jgi:hypothetical protein